MFSGVQQTAFLLLVLTFNGVQSGVHYPNTRRYHEYDYVVVGAGSAGSVIASRLSEHRNVRVLLLEAGGPPPLMAEVPLLTYELVQNKETEWGYYTEPQKDACLAQEGQRCFWSRYKALGGCSSHNFMLYVRGNRRDYDNWAQMGAKGWGWDEVRPFFEKAEGHAEPQLPQCGYPRSRGHLTVSWPAYENKLREAYLEAGLSLNYTTVDYNGPSQTGFGRVQATERDGLRCSTEKGYLRPAVSRKNLDILTHCRVLSVQFSRSKRATGVVYEDLARNRTMFARAKREVILSAGVIGSPHLLLLSGIGPKEDIEKFGIPVVADLPVGLNMQDHIAVAGQVWTLNDSVGIVFSRDINGQAIAELLDGRGVLTSPGTGENLVFISSSFQNKSEDWPDLELLTTSAWFLGVLPEYKDRDATNIFPHLIRPKSRGFLKLRSADPHVHPILDPQYFSVEEDMLRLVEGMRFARLIMQTPALQRFDPKPVLEAVPGCSGLDWDSDEYLTCQARQLSSSIYHPCCTAKMGDPDDPTTVVDSALRVKGVKGLRVADASIMPQVVSGNTNGPCVMIGEKAAHMIMSSTDFRSDPGFSEEHETS